ncbi:unnamed protein product [Phytomonas sp. EM1]|nr:unnamed protein product [Phytomonas sp. EM1]|eukprot:CCW61796.1 unnamed protein product [Phytomonas sp. isolate EM1]
MDRHSLRYVLMVSGQQSQLHNPNAIVFFSEQMQTAIMRGSTPRKNFLIDTTTPRGDVVITEDSAMKSVNSWVTLKVTEGIQRGLHEWSVYIENQGETSDGSGLMLGIVPQNFSKYDSFISQGGGWCLSRAGKFYGNWRRQDANVPTLTYGTGDRVVFLLNYDNATMMVRVGNTYVIGEIHNLSTEVFPAISLHYRQQVVRFEYHQVCENSTTKQLDWMQRGVLPSAAAFIPLTYEHVERMPLASYLYSEAFKDRAIERTSASVKSLDDEKDFSKILPYDSIEASRARLVTLANAFAAVRRYAMPSGRCQLLSPHVSAEHLRQRAYDSLRRTRGDDIPLHDVGLNFWATMVFNLFSSALQGSDSNPMASSLIKSLMDFLLSMPPFSLAEVSRGHGSSLFPTHSSSGIATSGFGGDVSRIFPGILQLGVCDICRLVETPKGENKKELSPVQEALMELIVLIALQRGLVHEVLRVCRYLLRYPQQTVSRPLVNWLLHHEEVLQPSLELPDFCRAWRACKSTDSLVPTGLSPHHLILSVAYGNMCLFVHSTDGISKWVSNSQGVESPFTMSSHTKEPKQYTVGVSRSSMATVRTHLLLLTDVMSNAGVAFVVYMMTLAVHKVCRLDDVGDSWPRGLQALPQLVSAEGDTFLLVYKKHLKESSTVPMDGAAALSADPTVSKGNTLSHTCSETGDYVKVCGFSFTSFSTPLWVTTLEAPQVRSFTLRTSLALMKRSYIDLGPPELALQLSGGYVTVELWIRFLDTENTSTFYQHGDKSTGGEVFLETAQLDGAFGIRGGYRHDTRGSCVVSAPLPPTITHLFLHIALVFDGQWGLYFNGEQVAWNRQGPHVFLESPRRRWTMGNNCICELAGLRVWRMNRSAREIARDYKHYLAGDEPGLLAQFLFNEASGNVAFNYVKCENARHAVCVGSFTHIACDHHPLRACVDSKGIRYGSSPNGDAVFGENPTETTPVIPFRSPIHDWRDLTHARCSVVRGLLMIATPIGSVAAPYPVQNGHILSFFDLHSGFLYSSLFHISSRDPAKCFVGSDPDGRAWELFEIETDSKSPAEEGFAHTVSKDKKKSIFASMLPFEREEDLLTTSHGNSAVPQLSSLFAACSTITDSSLNPSNEAAYPPTYPAVSVGGTCGRKTLSARDCAQVRLQGPSSVSLPGERNHDRGGVSGPSPPHRSLTYLDLAIKLFEVLGKRAQVEPMGEVLQLFSPLADDVGQPCVQEIKKTFQEHLRWIKGPGAPRAVALSSSSSEMILHWTLIIFLRFIRRVQGYGLHPSALGLSVCEYDKTSELFGAVLNSSNSALSSRSLLISALNNTSTCTETGKQDRVLSPSPDAALPPVDDGTTLLAILNDIIFGIGTQMHSHLGQLAQQIVMESMSIFMPNARYRAAVLRDSLANVSLKMNSPPSSTAHVVPSKESHMASPEQTSTLVPLLDGIVCSFSSVCSVSPLLYTDLDNTDAPVSPNSVEKLQSVSQTALKEIIDTQQALMKLCLMRQRSLLSGFSNEYNRGHSTQPLESPTSASPFFASLATQLQVLDKTGKFVALQDAISSFQLLLFSTLCTDTSGFGLFLDKVFPRQTNIDLTSSSNLFHSTTENDDKENIEEVLISNKKSQKFSKTNDGPVVENWVRNYYEIFFDFATESLKFSKRVLSRASSLQNVHEAETMGDQTNSSLARGSLENVLAQLKLYVPDSVLHSAITAIPILLQRSDASWFLDLLHNLIPLCKDVRDEIQNFAAEKNVLETYSTPDPHACGTSLKNEVPHKPGEESALEALYKAVIFTTSCIATSMVFTSTFTSSVSDVPKVLNTSTIPSNVVSPTPIRPDTASGLPLFPSVNGSRVTNSTAKIRECVDKGKTSVLQEITKKLLLSGGVVQSFFDAAHTPESLPVLNEGSRRQIFLLNLFNSNTSHWIASQRGFDALAPRVPDRISVILAYLAVASIFLSNEPLQTTGSRSEEIAKALVKRVMRRLTSVRNELLWHHTKEQKSATAFSDILNDVQCRCSILLSTTCLLDAAASDEILYLLSQNSTVDGVLAFPTQPRQRWFWVRRRLRLLAIRWRADVYRNDALSLSSSINLVSQVACSTSFSAVDLINTFREREELVTIRLRGLTQLLHLMQSQPSCTENVSFLLSGGFGHHKQMQCEDNLAGCRHTCIWKLRSVEYDILWHFMKYAQDRSCHNVEGKTTKCESVSNKEACERSRNGNISSPVLCAALKLAWHPRGFAFLCKYHVVEFIVKTYASIFEEYPQVCAGGRLPSLREEDLVARQHRREVLQFQRKISQTVSPSFKRPTTRGKEHFTSATMDGGDTDSLEGPLVRTLREQAKYTALDSMKHLGLRCATALQNEDLTRTERMACNAFLTHLFQIIMTEMDSCLSYLKRSTLEFEQHHLRQTNRNEGSGGKKATCIFSPELNLLLEQIEVFSSLLSTIMSAFCPSYKFGDASLSQAVATMASIFYQLVSLELSLWAQTPQDDEFPANVTNDADQRDELKFTTLIKLSAQIRLIGCLLMHNSPRIANECFARSEIKELCYPHISNPSLEPRRESSQNSTFLSLFAFAVRCLSATGLSSLSKHALLMLRQVLLQLDWAAELEGLVPIFQMDLKGHSALSTMRPSQTKVDSGYQNGQAQLMNSWKLLCWVSALGGCTPLVPCEGMRVYYHEEGNSAIVEGYLIDARAGNNTVTIVPTNRACGDMRDLIEGRLRPTRVCREADPSGKSSFAVAGAAEDCYNPIVWGKEDNVSRDFVLQPSPLEPASIVPYEGIAHNFIVPALEHFLSDLHNRNRLMCLDSVEVVVLSGFVSMALQCALTHPPFFDELLECGTFLLIRRLTCIQKPHVPLPMNYINDYTGHALHRYVTLLRLECTQNNRIGVALEVPKDDKGGLNDPGSPKRSGGAISNHEGEVKSRLPHAPPEMRVTLQAHQRIASLLSNSFLYYDGASLGQISDSAGTGLGNGVRPIFFHPNASQFHGVCFLRDPTNGPEAAYKRNSYDQVPWSSSFEEGDPGDSEERLHAIASASRSEGQTSALCFSLSNLVSQAHQCDAKVVIEPIKPRTRSFPLWANAIAFEASIMLSDQLFPELGDYCAIPSLQSSSISACAKEALGGRKRDASVFSILTVYASVDSQSIHNTSGNVNKEPDSPASSATPILQLFVEKGNLKCAVNVTSFLWGSAKRSGSKPRTQDNMSNLVECSLPLKNKHWNCFMHVAVMLDAQRLTLARAGEVTSVPLTLTTLDVLTFIFQTDGVVRQLVLGNTSLLEKAPKDTSNNPTEGATSLPAENEDTPGNHYHRMVFITSLRMTNSTLFMKTAIKDIAEMVARDHILMNLNDSAEGNTCLFQLREGTGDTVGSFCRQFRGKLSGLIRWANCLFRLPSFLVDLPDKPLLTSNRDEPFLFPHEEITTFMNALDFNGLTLITAQLAWSLVVRLSQATVKQAMLQSLSTDYRLHVLCGRRLDRVLQLQQKDGKVPALTEYNYFNPFRIFDHIQLSRQLADLFSCGDEDYLPVSSANLLRDFMLYVVRYCHSADQLDLFDELIEEMAVNIKLMLSFEEEVFHMEIPLTLCPTGNDSSDCTNSRGGSAPKSDAKLPLLMPLALFSGGKGHVKVLTTMNGRCEQLTVFRDRAMKNVLVKYPDLQGIWSDTEMALVPDRSMPWTYFSVTPASRPPPQSLGGPFASQLEKKLCLIVSVASLRGVVMEILFTSLAQEIKKSAALSGSKNSSDKSKWCDPSRMERSLPAFLNASMVHYLSNSGVFSLVPKDRYTRYRTHAINILACVFDLWAAFPHLQPYDHVPLHVSLSHINVCFMEALHHRGRSMSLPFDHNSPVASSLGVYYSCVQSLFSLMFNAIRLDCLWTKRSFRQRVAYGWHQILKVWGNCAITLSTVETAPCATFNNSGESKVALSVDRHVPQLDVTAIAHRTVASKAMRCTILPDPFSSAASTGVDSGENNLDTVLHSPDTRYGGHIVSMQILQPSNKSLALTSASVSCTALGNGEWRVRRSCGHAMAISSCGFTSGRFYFELRLLETEGAVSVGVVTDRSQLSKSGVEMIGAYPDSWGFDISHQCLLIEGYRSDLEEHINWAAGDILGVLMDLEQKELVFLYHGKRLAELTMHRKQAFNSKTPTTSPPICSYFPCVSVNSCMCVVNLGEAPFAEDLPLGFLPVNPKLYCNPQMCRFWYAMIAVKWVSRIKESKANDGTVQQTFVPDGTFQTVHSYIRKYCEGRDGPLSVDILCSAPHVCVNRHTNEIYTENHTTGPCIMHAGVAVRRGRWYYEVLLKGIIDLSVGWVVAESNGGRGGGTGGSSRVLGDDNESWVIETERMVVRHNGRVTRLRHHNWRDGDVLGCLLDCDSGTMSFTVNGRLVLEVHDIEGDGILFKNVVCPEVGLSPVVKAHYMRGSIVFLCNRRDLLYPPGKSYKPIGAEDVITDAMRTYYLSGKDPSDAPYRQPLCLSQLEKMASKISRSMDLSLHNFSAYGLCYALESKNFGRFPSLSTLGSPASAIALTCTITESLATTQCYETPLQARGAAAASPFSKEEDANSVKVLFELLNIFSSAAEVLMALAQEVSIPHRTDSNLAYPVYIGPFRDSLHRLRRFALPYLGIRTIRHALQETCSASSETLRLRVNRRKALATMQTNITNSPSALATRMRDSLFGQIFSLLADKDYSFFCRNRNLWTVSFYGEGADDVGGPYRESLAQLCSELMSTKLPLFMPIPSQGSDLSEQWDAFVIHPLLAPPVSTAMYRFIGRLMAGCLRGAEPLSLYFPSFVWKLLVGDVVDMEDLAQTDVSTFRALQYIENTVCLDSSSLERETEDIDEELSTVLCPDGFVMQDGTGTEHEMIYNGRNISVNRANAHDYVRLMLSFRLTHLVSAQLYALCEGFHQSVPLYAVSSLKWFELEALVCGQRDYDPDALLDAARYENLEPSDTRVVYLRQVLRGFTREQRALFARFVSGRERLPQGIQLKILPDHSNARSPRGQRFTPPPPPQPRSSSTESPSPRSTQAVVASSDHVVESFDDDRLPHASTCFYWLTLPQYSSVEVMHDKLLYAIEQCTEIDADFRVYDDEAGAQPDQPTLTRMTLEAEDEFEDFSHLL